MPGLNQTICWNLLMTNLEIIQSAGNLLILEYLGILRDHTFEIFNSKIWLIDNTIIIPHYNYSWK